MGRGKRKRHPQQYSNDVDDSKNQQLDDLDFFQPDIEGAHLYTDLKELPWDLQPYWKHRQSMFSLYDQGIWTTDDSWFEATHECIASKIAHHVMNAKVNGKLLLLDCFAGIGGNAIAFARSGAFKRVYAIEKNLAALECARHNARIYGVHDQITFFHGDCFELLGLEGDGAGKIESLVQVIKKAGIVFASPPWGGPGYKQAGQVFDLNQMPYNFAHLYSKFSQITHEQIHYLPRTSDLNQISDVMKASDKAQVVHYCVHENSKALCLYLGSWKEIT